MKTLKTAAVMTAFFVIVSASAMAQTIHALLVINTEDAGIGCVYDLQNWERELKIIEANSGMTVKKTVLKDRDWSVETLSKALSALAPGAKDAVLFYYSGHGFRWKDTSNRWPVLALQDDGWMELNDIYQKLLSKKPRLLIVMSDSCNATAPYAAPAKPYRSRPSPEIIKENYRALFADASGAYIASGCVPGQYSFGGEPDGGAYTIAFMGALDEAVKSKGATWKDIFDRSVQPLIDGKQQPQYAFSAKPGAAVAAASTVAPAATPIKTAAPTSAPSKTPAPSPAKSPAPSARPSPAASPASAGASKAVYQATYAFENGVSLKTSGSGTIKIGRADGRELYSVRITVSDASKNITGITYMVNDSEDWVENGDPAEGIDEGIYCFVAFLDSDLYQARYRVHILDGDWTEWFSEGDVAADWENAEYLDAIELGSEIRVSE
jgi:hypothetical protein